MMIRIVGWAWRRRRSASRLGVPGVYADVHRADFCTGQETENALNAGWTAHGHSVATPNPDTLKSLGKPRHLGGQVPPHDPAVPRHESRAIRVFLRVIPEIVAKSLEEWRKFVGSPRSSCCNRCHGWTVPEPGCAVVESLGPIAVGLSSKCEDHVSVTGARAACISVSPSSGRNAYLRLLSEHHVKPFEPSGSSGWRVKGTGLRHPA